MNDTGRNRSELISLMKNIKILKLLVKDINKTIRMF